LGSSTRARSRWEPLAGLLYRTEHTLLLHQGIRTIEARPLVRAGNPPLFFWLLQPLSRLPFRTADLLWTIGMYTLSALGLLSALRALNWERWRVPTLLFLLMPQVVLSAYYGGATAIIFAGLGLTLLAARDQPFLAGMLATVGWLKPQLALPLVLIIGLFQVAARGRFFVGLLAGTAALLGATLATTGLESLHWWLQGLVGYSSTIAAQPNIASIAGLYVRSAGADLRLALSGVMLVVTGTLTAWWWWRTHARRGLVPPQAWAWLWLAWFLATPYGHFPDEILLAYPVLALLGRNADLIAMPHSVVTLYLLLASLALFSWAPHGVQLLWLPLMVVCALAAWSARTAGVDRYHLPIAVRKWP
jgi:Glycosyltransferase family 87